MTVVLANNARSTLAADINSIQTTLVVEDADTFPSLGVGDYFYCTLERTTGAIEIVKVTQIAGSTFTIVRGQEDTIAIPFEIGARVELRITVQNLEDHFTDQVQEQIGVTVQAWDADLDTWATLTPSANFQTLVPQSFAQMRASLDLEVGVDVQAFDADLSTWATLTPSANFQTLVPQTFAQMRASLDLEVGVDVQAFDADLTTWATLTPSANFQTLVPQSFAQMRASLDLEAGTDFYSISAANAAIAAVISDTAYDATSWNGVTTIAPSKNAVRDKIAALAQADIAGLLTTSDVVHATLTVNNSGIHILDTNATHDLILAVGSNLAADRTLTITTGDADRTLTLSGNLTVGATSSISGTAYVTSGTDVAVADGGTGASTAAAARTNLVVMAQGLVTIPVMAGAMVASITNGAGSSVSESTTNDVTYATKDFDQTTQEFAQFQVPMPKSWNAGTVTFHPIWTASAGTGTVVFGLQAFAASNDDAIDTAFGTEQTSTDTLIATGDVHIGPTSAAITIAGTPADDDLIFFRIKRNVADDTLTGDAKLIGIRLFFTQNAEDDT